MFLWIGPQYDVRDGSDARDGAHSVTLGMGYVTSGMGPP